MAGTQSGSPRQTLRQSQAKVLFRKHFWEQSIGSEQMQQGRGGGQERACIKQNLRGGTWGHASELSCPGAGEVKAFVSRTHHAALDGCMCPGTSSCLYMEAEYVPETKRLRWGQVGEQAHPEVQFSAQQDGNRMPGDSIPGWSADNVYYNTHAADLSNRSSRAQSQLEHACGYPSDFVPCYHTSMARSS